MSDVTFRLLDENDLEIFRRIRLEALRNASNAFASSAEAWAAFPEAEWRRRLGEALVFVAFLGDDPVGMMGLTRFQPAKKAHRALVSMVYMRESLRGLGVSPALLAALIHSARRRGIRQLELSVNADNAVALRFYRRLGFAEVGRIPAGVLQDGVEIDEIVMARRIDG